MNFYGVRDLSANAKTVLKSVSGNGAAIITDNGKPTAILIGIDEKSFENVYSMVERMKVQRAWEEIQRQSQINFPNGMTMDEIDEIIAEVRRGE